MHDDLDKFGLGFFPGLRLIFLIFVYQYLIPPPVFVSVVCASLGTSESAYAYTLWYRECTLYLHELICEWNSSVYAYREHMKRNYPWRNM